MATMTETNEHNLGSGILMPKLSNRFRVIFKDTNDQQIAESLTQQVLSINNLLLDVFSADNTFSITVEDDITGLAMDNVWNFIDNSETFIVELHSLDGNDNIIEIIKFLSVQVYEVNFANLNYNANVDGYITKVDTNYIGKLFDNTLIDRWVQNLSNIFISTEHKPKTSPLLVHHTISFRYYDIQRFGYKQVVK
jgi:hypothetical protein